MRLTGMPAGHPDPAADAVFHDLPDQCQADYFDFRAISSRVENSRFFTSLTRKSKKTAVTFRKNGISIWNYIASFPET